MNGQHFGNDSASCFLCCLTLLPVYHGRDDECTRQKPHKRLVATNHRISHSLPPMFPPSMLKVLLSVCLHLGLSISSESSLRPPASLPLLPYFLSSFLISLNLTSSTSLLQPFLPHTWRVRDLCSCVFLSCGV